MRYMRQGELKMGRFVHVDTHRHLSQSRDAGCGVAHLEKRRERDSALMWGPNLEIPPTQGRLSGRLACFSNKTLWRGQNRLPFIHCDSGTKSI